MGGGGFFLSQLITDEGGGQFRIGGQAIWM